MRAYISSAGGSGTGTSFIIGSVEYYDDLPAVTPSYTGKLYLVTKAQGIWFINRKPAGLYLCDGVGWYLCPDLDFLKNASFETMTIGQADTAGSFKFMIDENSDLALYYYDGANWQKRETFSKV
jgi:hypothetical protein